MRDHLAKAYAFMIGRIGVIHFDDRAYAGFFVRLLPLCSYRRGARLYTIGSDISSQLMQFHEQANCHTEFQWPAAMTLLDCYSSQYWLRACFV